MDSETIEAAILHDVVEDTPMELADVQKDVYKRQISACLSSPPPVTTRLIR